MCNHKEGATNFVIDRSKVGLSPAPGQSGGQKVGGLPSWSVQLDSPGVALTVGGWIRPGGPN